MNENQERATFEEFTDDQWWYKELDVIARSRDQRRAMAVVRNLLRQFSEALASLAAAPVQAVPDAMTYADKAQIAVTKEWARGWDDCRTAMLAAAAPQVPQWQPIDGNVKN